MKITIEKSWKKQEPARTERMELFRAKMYRDATLCNRILIRHTSKKAHLIVKVV